MNCPKCQGELKSERSSGFDGFRCQSCQSWFYPSEVQPHPSDRFEEVLQSGNKMLTSFDPSEVAAVEQAAEGCNFFLKGNSHKFHTTCSYHEMMALVTGAFKEKDQ